VRLYPAHWVLLLIGITAALVAAVVLGISAHVGPFPLGEHLVQFDNSKCPAEKGFDAPIKINLGGEFPLGLSAFAIFATWRLDFGDERALDGGWMDSENQLWFRGSNGALIIVDRFDISYYPHGRLGECLITGLLPH
jgi:hypothetical protein